MRKFMSPLTLYGGVFDLALCDEIFKEGPKCVRDSQFFVCVVCAAADKSGGLESEFSSWSTFESGGDELVLTKFTVISCIS